MPVACVAQGRIHALRPGPVSSSQASIIMGTSIVLTNSALPARALGR
jgi:hypothetical protein